MTNGLGMLLVAALMVCCASAVRSVRGLGPGSEVTVHDLPVGHVIDVRLTYNPANDEIRAPVRCEVEPERILGVGAKAVFATSADAANLPAIRPERQPSLYSPAQ